MSVGGTPARLLKVLSACIVSKWFGMLLAAVITPTRVILGQEKVRYWSISALPSFETKGYQNSSCSLSSIRLSWLILFMSSLSSPFLSWTASLNSSLASSSVSSISYGVWRLVRFASLLVCCARTEVAKGLHGFMETCFHHGKLGKLCRLDS